MDTIYCEKCGLLHDPEDGDCLGCDLIAENDYLRDWNENLRVEREKTIERSNKFFDENEKLKECVEFYANTPIDYKLGRLARKTLAELS